MEDILQVRAPGLNFHVLRDGDGLYLIDGGFLGGSLLLRRTLAKRGWDKLPIKGILVTHGHLDHIANIAALAEEHQAWVAAPRLDELHYLGKYPYRGVARVCGGWRQLGGLYADTSHFGLIAGWTMATRSTYGTGCE